MAKVADSNTYIVASIASDGKMEYLSFDSASGGYPYASASIRDQTSSLEQAIEWLKDAKRNLPRLNNPKVYEICLSEVDISMTSQDSNVVGILLSQLTPEQKSILRDILK